MDCDTCKEPCVRCGTRSSERVEQLVHSRLKSIYKACKAFKNSGGSIQQNSGGGGKSLRSGKHDEIRQRDR